MNAKSDKPEPRDLLRAIRHSLDPAQPASGTRLDQECRDLLQCHRALLRRLARPALPEALEGGAFLGSIYARAAAETELGPVLEAGLQPIAAPADLDWHQDEVLSAPEPLRVIDPSPAPGWLWSRIREDMRAGRALRQSQRRSVGRRALLAAGLLVGVLGLYALAKATNPGQNGTHRPFDPVQVKTSQGLPLDSLLGG